MKATYSVRADMARAPSADVCKYASVTHRFRDHRERRQNDPATTCIRKFYTATLLEESRPFRGMRGHFVAAHICGTLAASALA
jgi:hypothetical protein